MLNWLDPDRERAGDKYENIRKNLIGIFVWRGCNDAEDLADETINRVMYKTQELKEFYKGDPALYFYGVARNLIHEYKRSEQRRVAINTIQDDIRDPSFPDRISDFEKMEVMLKVLNECLDDLAENDRTLILSYYLGEKQSKIDRRKELAQGLRLSAFALRKRVHRLRLKLEKCVDERLKGLTTREQ
ncbi:MAG: sigma-70 family RNA polymerase sigma factor [Pyrinomonadaceae bacterium]